MWFHRICNAIFQHQTKSSSRIQDLTSRYYPANTEKNFDSCFNGYKIERVTETDSDDVLKMLKQFYFNDEPLNQFLKFGECKELEKWCLACIGDNCSFKAVKEDRDIIGVFLNGKLLRAACEQRTNRAEKFGNPKFKKIMGMMDQINANCNVFDLYPDVDVIVDGRVISVHPDYRGKQLMCALAEGTLNYMKERELPVMHVLCTSQYAARNLRKMGFCKVYEMRYSDYKVKGKALLQPADPHIAAIVMVKEVKDFEG